MSGIYKALSQSRKVKTPVIRIQRVSYLLVVIVGWTSSRSIAMFVLLCFRTCK